MRLLLPDGSPCPYRDEAASQSRQPQAEPAWWMPRPEDLRTTAPEW